MTPWKRKKLRKQLSASFGKEPDKDYFPGDMESIRTYSDACRKEEADSFHVDETTWKDLDMDSLYRRINACQCTAGEQYLYAMLRTPMKQSGYAEQLRLIRLMEAKPELRLSLQLLLYRIGCSRHVNLTSILRPAKPSPLWLTVYILMGLLFPASFLAAALLGAPYIVLPMAVMVANTLLHTYRRNRCEADIMLVNYCVTLIFALNRLKKRRHPELEPFLAAAFAHLDRMKPILRAGPVVSIVQSDTLQAAVTVCLLMDLIAYEILRRRLSKYHDDFLAVHRAIGRIDASIAVASCRASLPVWCEPEIDFSADRPFLRLEGIAHPLLKEPVRNDLSPQKSMLITGSNASGKSTCLKAAAISILMAETLCTCPCRHYAGSPFRVFTSLAPSDDLLAGESFYIAEIKALKRILDARARKGFLFCAIDELLRGTNTVERIAASAEILKALVHPRVLGLIATHDAELCALCGSDYELAHFEETVTDQGIRFDYRLRPGPAETRNAILLLKLMGFDDAIVGAASGRADRYMKTGRWTSDPPRSAPAGAADIDCGARPAAEARQADGQKRDRRREKP